MSPTIPVVTIPAAAIPVAAIPVPATPVPATITAPPPPVEPRSAIPELPFSFRLPPSYQHSHNLRPSPQTGPPARSLLLVRSSFQRRIQKEYQLTVRHPQGQPAWDDHDLFRGLRTAYNRKLRTVWERYLSLKGLKLIRLLEVRPTPHPVPRHPDHESADLDYPSTHAARSPSKSRWSRSRTNSSCTPSATRARYAASRTGSHGCLI